MTTTFYNNGIVQFTFFFIIGLRIAIVMTCGSLIATLAFNCSSLKLENGFDDKHF